MNFTFEPNTFINLFLSSATYIIIVVKSIITHLTRNVLLNTSWRDPNWLQRWQTLCLLKKVLIAHFPGILGQDHLSRSSFIFSFLGKSSLDINNSKALKWLPVVLVKVLLWCRNLTGYASSVGVISSCLLDTLLIHCHLQGCLRSWKNYCVSRQRGVILITWFWILTF